MIRHSFTREVISARSWLLLIAAAFLPTSTAMAATLITDIGTLTPGGSRITTIYDANRNARVVGNFDHYGRCNIGPIAFTWAPGGVPVRLTLPGYQWSVAIAVNDSDEVVGWALDGCSYGAVPRMFSWTPLGGIVDRGPGEAWDVNDSGQILGQGPVEVAPGQFERRAFVWTPGQPKVLLPNSLGTLFPKRLSNNGHAVGVFLSDQGTQRAFYWTAGGGILDLGNYQSTAADVNGAGQVVGDRTASPSSPQRAFSWTAGGGFTGFALDDEYSFANDVNEAGQAVGWSYIDSEEHAISWTSASGIVDLGTLARDDGYAYGCGYGRAYAVNDRGLVVGDSYVQKGNLCWHHAFAWTSATGMMNLGTLEYGSAEAYAVSDSGRVFGQSYTHAGESHAVMWQTAFTVALPDVNGNGVPDLALLRDGPIHAEIRDGSTGALVRAQSLLGDSFVPIAAAAVPDSDGNGIPELAVLAARRSDGRVVVETQNLSGAAVTRQVWFGPGQTPKRLAVVGDADSNGIVDIAVLSVRKSDGRGLVEVRNAFGAPNPRVFAVAAGTQVKNIEPVGDADNNGVPEFAVLGTRDSDGRVFVEVRNAAGAANARTIWFASGHAPVDLAAVADADKNGVNEVAVLSRRISDDRFAVEVKNASGPTNAAMTWVARDLRALALKSLGDADGNTVPELAVLSHRNFDARAVVEVKNAAGPVNGRAFWLPTGLRGGDVVSSPDTSGDGIPEVFVVMTRGDARIVAQRVNASGASANQSYWFRP